jgi:ATP-dependent Clp protease ATP-binding subunit ClpC
MKFDLRKTEIYKSLTIERFSYFNLVDELKQACLVFFVLFVILFAYGFFGQKWPYSVNRPLLGFLIIFFCLFICFWIQEAFFNIKIKKPALLVSLKQALSDTEKYNIAELLSLDSAKAINSAIKSSTAPEITSTHILRFILKSKSAKLDFIFTRLLLDVKKVEDKVKKEIDKMAVVKTGPVHFSENFEKAIEESLKLAAKKNHERIEVEDLLSVLAAADPVFKGMLLTSRLKAEDIENLCWWLEIVERRERKRKIFWDYDNLIKMGTLAKSWGAGYTITLDKYAKDLTEIIRGKEIEFIGHQEELEGVERVLATRGENNVLLVGQPGVGKKSLVYHLAQRSLKGESLPEVNFRRVMELDMSSLLAQIENTEEVEVILDKIFQEATKAGNITLVIEGIDGFLGQQSGLGTINISGILGPYLRYTEFQIIGITTYEGLHKNIERNSAILSLFSKVEVKELSWQDTLLLLEDLAPSLENQYKIFISYPALREIVSMSDRYFPSQAFPAKAIDLLKEVVVQKKKESILLPSHVAKLVTQKTEIPVGDVEGKEKEVLLNLEEKMHKRIINQEQAVKEICTALRRARSEITMRKGPMGAFLFLGPTGVGKTETSKALAFTYFGSEDRMVRMDMSEFQNTKDIDRLLGTAEEDGLLTTKVREDPFSLVLLDEFEKAHPNILNLFLQVFDEGYITDGVGRKVDFKNSIIIATSNAGYEIILKAVKSKENWDKVKQKILDYIFEQRIFRPELVNRFDATVVFTPLTKQNLMDIAQLMLSSLGKNLKEKGIEFIITKELKERVVELGYNPTFGAREMRRVIQENVENNIASAFLADKLPSGCKIQINPKDFSLIIG